MEILSQREQLSRRNTSHFDEEGPDYPCLEAARSEFEASSHDEAARVRYVTKLAEMDAQMTPHIMHNPDLATKEAYASEAAAIGEELRKHPMPRNVEASRLSQLLVGEWAGCRHGYTFRADGTYGMIDTDQREKWRIDGNEYVDDVSRGPIILLDRNYFIYGCGEGVTIYTRANTTSTGDGDKPSDMALKQKLLGYWKSPRQLYHMAADGKMYVGRGQDLTTERWNVRNGKFYWWNVPYKIVLLTEKEFVFREMDGQGEPFTLVRSTKAEADSD